jgi:hypothetical protein
MLSVAGANNVSLSSSIQANNGNLPPSPSSPAFNFAGK